MKIVWLILAIVFFIVTAFDFIYLPIKIKKTGAKVNFRFYINMIFEILVPVLFLVLYFTSK